MNHKLFRKTLLIIAFLGWLFYLYHTSVTYLNISLSDNYNAFSQEDINSLLFTLKYGFILSFFSIFFTFLLLRNKESR